MTANGGRRLEPEWTVAMSLKILLLILVSVSFSAIAQLVLKLGMSAPNVQSAIAGDSRIAMAQAIGLNLKVVGGLAIYALGAVLWLFVLARIDVSMAYPFVGLGFLLTMAFGALFLGEPMSFARIAGTVMVASGVYLVAQS